MRIEVLFPEICNLYGDLFNAKYLAQSTNAEIIETTLSDTPRFVNEDITIIYMAPMTEKSQEIVIEKLMPYKEKIKELIDNGQLFLFTGNAWEILGQYIENEDGTKIEGLKILNTYSKRKMMSRENSLFLGEIDNIEIVGFKAQFSTSFGDNSKNFAFKVKKGWGINKESKLEGIRENNFFGTYLLGPVLVLNPLFTKYILKIAGEKEEVAFEKEAMEAYNARLKEFKDEKTKY